MERAELTNDLSPGQQPDLLRVQPETPAWHCAICGTVRACPLTWMRCDVPELPGDSAPVTGAAYLRWLDSQQPVSEKPQ